MKDLEEMKRVIKELQEAGAEVTIGLMDDRKDNCSFECGPADNRHKIYYDWNDGELAFMEKADRLKRQMDYSDTIGLSKQKGK